ncbi:hypothetical protein V6N13_130148 [Hibiscus sabdariffa]
MVLFYAIFELLAWLVSGYTEFVVKVLAAGIDGVESKLKLAFEILIHETIEIDLVAGVYTTIKGARVTWGYINRILGQQLLIQVAKFSWLGRMSPARNQFLKYSTTTTAMESKNSLGNVVLHPSLKTRIEHLAWLLQTRRCI